MTWSIIVVVLVIAIVLIVVAAIKKAPMAKYPYRRKTPLFTKAERSFLGVLDQAVSGELRILGKVRVADVLTPEKGLPKSEWQSAFNRISKKHFDFLLCEPGGLDPICAIELNDKSHNRRERKARDEFLDKACEAAGIALHHFDA
jgi:hypothetical protein